MSKQDEYIERVQDEYKVRWFRRKSADFQTEANRIIKSLNVRYHPRGRNVMMECLQFGGNMEFWNGFKDGNAIYNYFWDCYAYAIKAIGYLQTEKNIICAIMVTEKHRRNLFVYYLPITEKWKVKIMGDSHSEKGNRLQLYDEFGEPVYYTINDTAYPLLCHSEFWKMRGEQKSYSMLQEDFYNSVSKHYRAKRGESTSRLKYTAPEQARRFTRFANDVYDEFPPIKGIWE